MKRILEDLLLLPCPFCGCEKIQIYKGEFGYRASCSKCLANVGRASIYFLRRAWNRRNELT